MKNLVRENQLLNKEYENWKKEKAMHLEDNEQYKRDKITTFHLYNEIKDTTQMILGKLAARKGKTVKDLYQEYGLDEKD